MGCQNYYLVYYGSYPTYKLIIGNLLICVTLYNAHIPPNYIKVCIIYF